MRRGLTLGLLAGIVPLASLAALTSGLAWAKDDSAQLGFRIRSGFNVPLNSDEGWAGALNENVSIAADQPFRIRFEAELPSDVSDKGPFRLEARRNGGNWQQLEFSDFPHPAGELKVVFQKNEVGSLPPRWIVAKGSTTGLSVARSAQGQVLRAMGDEQPLIGLYELPGELSEFEFEAEVRFTHGTKTAAGLVFGYLDAKNYGCVLLDAAEGVVRVSRFVDGQERVITEENSELGLEVWQTLALEYEERELTVSLNDATLEFTVDVGALDPASSLGLLVPAGGTAEFAEFSMSATPQTPRVSIVSCSAYEHGASTVNLLAGSSTEFQAGTGVAFANRTRSWGGERKHGEFEWPLVVRRYADGPVTNEAGDSFEFRMVTADGHAIPRANTPLLRLEIPPGHVGGTFVETPGRIGPFQAANGDLYFIMEPTETDNVFMMVKSTDHGQSWREVDGAHRPRADDLESVDARQVEDTIHIIHQVTEATWYHAFRTSDHPTQPDSWAIRDELAGRVDAVAQAATLVCRSDGSLVAFFVGQTRIHYSVRSPEGIWGPLAMIDPDIGPNQAGPQAVLGADDVVHLAYYGIDGTIWYRSLQPDGKLGPRRLVDTRIGTTRSEYGVVLPLLFIPESNTVVILYRVASGELWERRVISDGSLTKAVRVTERSVVQNAVDSQQPGADVLLDGTSVHVLFIEESSRSIFSTHDRGGWQPAQLRIGDILGSWIRGSILTRPDGTKVLGYIYDAGSFGGTGMNRFAEIPLRLGAD